MLRVQGRGLGPPVHVRDAEEEAGVIGTLQLFTSHWRNRELADVDATIIGISRGTPRGNPGFRYRVLRSLAPGDEAWRQKDRESFERAYLDQLEALGSNRILADLRRISGGRPCVCLCWEKPHEEFCHRWVLARFIDERAGIVIPELAPGMLAKRPDAQQHALFD